MKKFLNYLQERDKMISEFKFFHGPINHILTAVWTPEIGEDLNSQHNIDTEDELTRLLSEEISRTIDDEILQTITRRINGGSNLYDNISY